MGKKKSVSVDLRLPKHTLLILEQLAEQGILGETAEEVALHMIRHYVFVEMAQLRAKGQT